MERKDKILNQDIRKNINLEIFNSHEKTGLHPQNPCGPVRLKL
jgi:hypothetical protein